MMKRSNLWSSLTACALVAGCLSLFAIARTVHSSAAVVDKTDAKITYPETKKDDVVDDYFGTKVADPYRWLEDENSPETKAWVEAQNLTTFAYLDKIPYREKLKARLTELFNYPRISAPFHRGDTYFFTKNDGLQNQSVYYIQNGMTQE